VEPEGGGDGSGWQCRQQLGSEFLGLGECRFLGGRDLQLQVLAPEPHLAVG
jgi:hypothetical protein